MSFNIRYGTAKDGSNCWDKRRDLVFQVLRDHRPDVVGLQEALWFQLVEIGKAFEDYSIIGVGRKDGLKEGECAAILYRNSRFRIEQEDTFWFSSTPDVPGSNDWGSSNIRICTWAHIVEKESGKAFYLYNVHLDHASQKARARGVELLIKKIQGQPTPDPIIVTGDFNAGEKSPEILYLKGNSSKTSPGGEIPVGFPVLVDTFRTLHKGAEQVGTFHDFKGRRDGEKIDYIFASSNAEVLNSDIIHDCRKGRYPSDHFPVFAEIRLLFGERRADKSK